jgi:hypothetical protein
MYTKNIVARPSLFIGVFRASSAGIRVVGNVLAAYSLSFSGQASSGPNVAFCMSNSTNTTIKQLNAHVEHRDLLQLMNNVNSTGPEVLLLAICVCAIVVSSFIWCTTRKDIE